MYTVIGTGMLRRVDPLQATAWAVLGGTLFLTATQLRAATGEPAPAASGAGRPGPTKK